MRLSEILSPDTITVGMEAGNRREVMEALLQTLENDPDYETLEETLKESIHDTLLEREKDIPMNMGEGIAFPHARISGLGRMFIAMAVLKSPLERESTPDGKPLEIVCMFILPEEDPTRSLKAISAMARILENPSMRRAVSSCTTAEEVFEIIRDNDAELDEPVTAGDLMQPERIRVYTHTPMQEVTRLMARANVHAVAVLDENDCVVGEISCDFLLSKNIPDYLKSMKSVPAVRDFDPFRKFFDEDSKQTAGDLMSRDFAVVEEDATLLEVVFLLSVRHYPRVYVCRNGKLAGAVDRIAVLHRVFNL